GAPTSTTPSPGRPTAPAARHARATSAAAAAATTSSNNTPGGSSPRTAGSSSGPRPADAPTPQAPTATPSDLRKGVPATASSHTGALSVAIALTILRAPRRSPGKHPAFPEVRHQTAPGSWRGSRPPDGRREAGRASQLRGTLADHDPRRVGAG